MKVLLVWNSIQVWQANADRVLLKSASPAILQELRPNSKDQRNSWESLLGQCSSPPPHQALYAVGIDILACGWQRIPSNPQEFPRILLELKDFNKFKCISGIVKHASWLSRFSRNPVILRIQPLLVYMLMDEHLSHSNSYLIVHLQVSIFLFRRNSPTELRGILLQWMTVKSLNAKGELSGKRWMKRSKTDIW